MSSNSHAAQSRDAAPRTWRGLFILFGVLALIALFYGEENWRGRRAWRKHVAELVRRGEPVERASVIPAPVPADQNFAMTPFLAPLFDFEPGTQKWRDTNATHFIMGFPADFNAASGKIPSEKIVRSNSWTTPHLDLTAWAAALDEVQSSNRTVSLKSRDLALPSASAPVADAAAAAQKILADLAQYDPVISELREASRRPYSRFNLAYENEDPAAILLPHLAVLKRATLLLQLRASAELAAGRADQAVQDVNLMFSLSDAIRREPVLISLLVRIAQLQITLQPVAEGLEAHQWTDPQLAALQERLSRFNFLVDAHQALESERILLGGGIIDYIRQAPDKYKTFCAIAESPGEATEGVSLAAAALAFGPSGWFYLEKVNYDRMFVDYVLPIIEPNTGRIDPARVEDLNAQFKKAVEGSNTGAIWHHKVFTKMLLPALANVAKRVAYGQAAADEAMLACALERYRLAQGSYPENLQALVPRYLPQLPKDVISGEPLKYHRGEDGKYVLYSVGWNQKDDGGVVGQTKTNGPELLRARNIDKDEGDWVWR